MKIAGSQAGGAAGLGTRLCRGPGFGQLGHAAVDARVRAEMSRSRGAGRGREARSAQARKPIPDPCSNSNAMVADNPPACTRYAQTLQTRTSRPATPAPRCRPIGPPSNARSRRRSAALSERQSRPPSLDGNRFLTPFVPRQSLTPIATTSAATTRAAGRPVVGIASRDLRAPDWGGAAPAIGAVAIPGRSRSRGEAQTRRRKS